MYNHIIDKIEENADRITRDLMRDFKANQRVSHYHDLSDEVLYDRIHHVLYSVYRRLGNWLADNKPKDTIFIYYSELGKERFHEGIPLQEVVTAFMLIKRQLWKFVIDNKMLDTGYGLNQLSELNFHVNNFFDKLTQSIVVGYEDEMHKNIQAETPGFFTRVFKRYGPEGQNPNPLDL